MLLLLLSRTAWLTGIGNFLVDAETPHHADIAVVLAGDSAGNRVLRSAELVKAGLVPIALVSGPSNCCYGIPESDLAIQFAVRHGYPRTYFAEFRNNGLSTREEARLMVEELRKRNLHNIALVTSNYHTRRAGRIYHALAPDLEFHMVAAPNQYFSPGTWWKTREGQKECVTEWAKTIANWFGL